MNNENMNDENSKAIMALHRVMDIITAILLLTKQITIIGVFVKPGRFAISVGGPIFGSSRILTKNNLAIEQGIVDILDILLAILLLSDQITITGLFISSGEFTINVSGPLFGYPKVTPSTLMLDNYKLFHSVVKEHYTVPPGLLSNTLWE